MPRDVPPMSNEQDEISETFQAPGELVDGDLQLRLEEQVPADLRKGLAY